VSPGRTMEWVLGAAHNTVDWDALNEYKVRIEADGPFGPMEPIEFVIIISDLKGSHATPGDNLHAVALQLYEITKAMNQVNGSISRLEPLPIPAPIESPPARPPIESSIPMEPLSTNDT
jgi:hypothetical protein